MTNNAAERALRGIAVGRHYAQMRIMRSWRGTCAESPVDKAVRNVLSRSSCT
jgi:hypothetical protein